jgi:hypothetical protein
MNSPRGREMRLITKIIEIGMGSMATPEQEIEADLKAMKIFLEMGNSKEEALKTFCEVFKNRKQKLQLKRRLDVIKEYVKNFEQKQIAHDNR